MMMTHGSLLSPGVLLESLGLDTRATFVIIPVVATTFTEIVMSGKLVLAAGIDTLVQVTPMPTTEQVHPVPDGVPFKTTPAGI